MTGVARRPKARLRHAKGISQEGLAHEAGINRTYVSKLEKGTSYAGLEIIAKLATVLEVEPSELITLPARQPPAAAQLPHAVIVAAACPLPQVASSRMARASVRGSFTRAAMTASTPRLRPNRCTAKMAINNIRKKYVHGQL